MTALSPVMSSSSLLENCSISVDSFYQFPLGLEGSMSPSCVVRDSLPDLDSSSAQTCFTQGMALLCSQQYEDAIAWFEWAIALNFAMVEAWYRRGEAQANLGHYQEALNSFEQALEFNPKDPEIWTFRAAVLIHLECYEEAVDSCDRAIVLQLHHKEAWIFRGVALNRLNRFQEAYSSYNNALDQQSSSWLKSLISFFKKQWTYSYLSP